MRAINTKAIPITINSSPTTISLSMEKPTKLSMFKNIISF